MMRLAPALVVVMVAVVALVTPGCGLVLAGGGFFMVFLFIVPQVPADDGSLVSEVEGLSFCRLVIVFSLSSPVRIPWSVSHPPSLVVCLPLSPCPWLRL